MKRTHIFGIIALSFGLSAPALATDGTSIEDVTVALAGDDAAAANDHSTAIGTYIDDSFSLSIEDVAVAVSALDGAVSGNFNAIGIAAVCADSGDNNMYNGVLTNFKGIAVASQNTGNAALTQQSVVVQANVNN
jgi:hypothetical protein